MKTISVIGSCICRDLFETNTENFSFHTDIRFANPISMFSEPVGFIHADFSDFPNDVKTVGGNWYKKNLIHDINKTAFDALEENHGEWLILDLAESRQPLAKISWKDRPETLLATYSVSLRAHYAANLKDNIFKNTAVEIINTLSYDDAFWDKTIRAFAAKITQIFPQEKIILIRNKPAREYVDVNGFLHPYSSQGHYSGILTCDLLLDKLNETFLACCPGCHVLEIPPHALGSQVHKWGNHYFHYTKPLYDYLLSCVKALTLEEDESLLPGIYDKYAAVFKEEFDRAREKTAKQNDGDKEPFSVKTLLEQYEEYEALGKKQKAMILFALDKKHFAENFKELLKGR